MARSQFFIVFFVLMAMHLMTGLFAHTLFTSKMKTGIYEINIPLINIAWNFDNRWMLFSIVSWFFCIPAYVISTIILGWSYRTFALSGGILYPVFIANQISMTISNTFYMYLKVGEIPKREGWIALVLLAVAAVLATDSGQNVKGP